LSEASCDFSAALRIEASQTRLKPTYCKLRLVLLQI